MTTKTSIPHSPTTLQFARSHPSDTSALAAPAPRVCDCYSSPIVKHWKKYMQHHDAALPVAGHGVENSHV